MKLGLITYRGHIMHFHIVPCSASGRTAPSTILLWGAAFLHAHVCARTFLYPFGAPHGSELVFHGGNPTGWYWLVVLSSWPDCCWYGFLFRSIDPIASSPIIQWAARIFPPQPSHRDRFESLVPIALHHEFLDPKHHCLCPCIGGCVVPRVPSG